MTQVRRLTPTALRAALCTLLVALSGCAFGPMYVPGSLAKRPDLEPASRASSGPWQVTTEMALAHTSHTSTAQATGAVDVADAAPHVLFIHGGPGAAPMGMPPALAALEGYTVHAYAQRGCGDSTKPFDRFESTDTWANIQSLEGTLGIGAQIADIERIRRILGAEKVILVGHSFGSMLAALYAAEFPERVQSLVLLAPPSTLAIPSAHPELFGMIRARLPEHERAGFDAFKARYLDFGHLFEKSTADLEALDREFAVYWEKASGPMPDAVKAQPGQSGVWAARAMYLSMGQKHDWTGALEAVIAPTVVVHADADLQDVAIAEDYVRAIQGATLVRVPGAGHFLHVTHGADVAAIIQAHLDSTR